MFFLAENVSGMISKTHIKEFKNFIFEFEKIGYHISYKLLNAKYYGVPQERKRVIIVGYSKEINKEFIFPEKTHEDFGKSKKVLLSNNLEPLRTLQDAIGDLPEPIPAREKNKTNGIDNTEIPNHEYMSGSFSTIYMSRNRKKEWGEPSFTIQAGGRHAPLHPKAKK